MSLSKIHNEIKIQTAVQDFMHEKQQNISLKTESTQTAKRKQTEKERKAKISSNMSTCIQFFLSYTEDINTVEVSLNIINWATSQ